MVATPALYSARPKVAIDDVDSPELANHLLSLVVTESIDGVSRCEVVFGNWGDRNGQVGFLYSDRATVDFGTRIAIDVGAGERSGTVFRGRVTGLEAHYPATTPPELAVLAEDRFQDLRMTRRTRTFEDVSDEDVIRAIASHHGLTAQVDVNGPTHGVVAQVNQSDLAFLRDRARLVDAEVWVDGDSLHVAARARRDGGAVTLTLGSDLREASVLADMAMQRTSFTVAGWDVAAKEAISFEAGSAAIQAELNGHAGGVALLEQAFGTRVESLVQLVPLTTAEAQARAEASMRAAARRFVTARGLAEGDARLRVGSYVELGELGAGFNGRYYLTEVQHGFDGTTGFATRFRAERPGLSSDGAT